MNSKFQIDASSLSNYLVNFDDLLIKKWSEAEKDGVLKFKFSESVQKRLIDGHFKFSFHLNVNRLTLKRKGQRMDSIKVDINKDEFNFTKINENERLFDIIINNLVDKKVINGTMIVNNAPIEFASSLLVLELDKCLPQIFLKESLLLALYVCSSSASKYLRLGFNSAGANASVNHNHWHVYYQEADLQIAKQPINNNQLIDWYLRSFVFELQTNDRPQIYLSLAIRIEKLINYITDHLKLAYNLFVTKCSTSTNTVRLFVWPRLPKFGSKDDSKIAFALCEFSGFFICKQFEMFNKITEQELIKMSKEYELSDHLFNELLNVKENIFSK